MIISIMNYSSVIYVDGCCNKNTNGNGWSSIVDTNGKCIIYTNIELLKDLIISEVETPKGIRKIIVSQFKDVKSQQNNGAELLGMVAGLRIAIKYHYKYLYSDSSLMVNYWSQDKISPKTRDKMDPVKYRYIQECCNLRKEFESKGGKVCKIDGDNNIADLGYHK